MVLSGCLVTGVVFSSSQLTCFHWSWLDLWIHAKSAGSSNTSNENANFSLIELRGMCALLSATSCKKCNWTSRFRQHTHQAQVIEKQTNQKKHFFGLLFEVLLLVLTWWSVEKVLQRLYFLSSLIVKTSAERSSADIGPFFFFSLPHSRKVVGCFSPQRRGVGEPRVSVSIHWAPSCFGSKCRQEIHSQGFSKFMWSFLQSSASLLRSVFS